MLYDVKVINSDALSALCQNDTYQAQELFRKNAKINPSSVSFNNLGVFYISEGIYTLDNSFRTAKKLGVSYLEKARMIKPLNLSYLALGRVCFEDNDYNGAICNFKKANALKSEYGTLYNLALSYYRNGMPENAISSFKKALLACSEESYFDTYASYLFSLIQVDMKMCHEQIASLFDDDTNNTAIERFVLAYLCDDMHLAEHLINRMLCDFDVGIEVTAMVFDCLIRYGKENKAEEYLNQKVQILKETMNYFFKQNIKKYKEIFLHKEYRKEVIATYQYIAPLVEQCCYYGCMMHNPL